MSQKNTVNSPFGQYPNSWMQQSESFESGGYNQFNSSVYETCDYNTMLGKHTPHETYQSNKSVCDYNAKMGYTFGASSPPEPYQPTGVYASDSGIGYGISISSPNGKPIHIQYDRYGQIQTLKR